jgi:hypothetical protein
VKLLSQGSCARVFLAMNLIEKSVVTSLSVLLSHILAVLQ